MGLKRVPRGLPLADRLLRHAVPAPDGCWNWPGACYQAKQSVYQYGQIKVAGRVVAVHRASYEAFVGPIPDGMTVDHMCFNTLCLNPEHLQLLTRSENSRRQRSALSKHCKRGHEFSPDNTWVRPSGRRVCKACQRQRIAIRRAVSAETQAAA